MIKRRNLGVVVLLIRKLYGEWQEYLRLTVLCIWWRQNNGHNETRIVRSFPLEKVSVGDFSYGPLDVYAFGNPAERLEIGRYVSIAEGVKFVLGGGHDITMPLSYPVRHKFMNEYCEASTRGSIVIEDDVWIGFNVIILSGVTIGRGAVIGAGSIVTRDIPPYSVAVGNPCKVKRYRFSDELLRTLQKCKTDGITPQFIRENKHLFTTELTILNVTELHDLLDKL
jgi:acetyltransferase-like isoleucine patch superfamily enzyme